MERYKRKIVPSFVSILQQFHDRVSSQNIADIIISNPDRLPELMDCFFHENLRICQRAAMPLGMIGKTHTYLLYPYVKRMLAYLDNPPHDAVVRNTIRTFQFMDFPEELEGIVFDKCMTYLCDLDQAIAIRVFSMTVCANISMKYPELTHELIPILEDQLPHGSTGFKSRGSKLLVKLRKIAETSNLE